jgi:HPt (histidine-containing phosphotransfer) domain-containing protein
LHRVGGNLRLYRAMLQQYAEDQAETPAALRAALAAGDAKTAERLAHALKGVSATLGIKPASEAGPSSKTASGTAGWMGSKTIWRHWSRRPRP